MSPVKRYELTDKQWEKIKGVLPGQPTTVGVTAKDHRQFVHGVIWILRSGARWRDLPERFGDFRVVHTRFSRWAARGVWKAVFEHLASDADNEYAMIDSTIVRAHQHSAGARKKGANRRPSDAAKAG